jgi:phage protein D
MVLLHENFSIQVDGSEISDIYPDLISLDVELDDDMASMFRLQLSASQEPDGTWGYIDDEQFSVWKKIVISAGFDDGAEDLITAHITHVRPYFDPDPSQCTLEIWGMDGSVLMDREEKLKDWPNKKDSDIASEVFQTYGFRATVDDTQVIHDEAISTIIQRETDFRFLRRLAKRNGFECFVDGETGYFRAPLLDETPQPLLAAHFGSETNLIRFSAEVNALTPANVSISQLDRTNKEVLETVVQSSQNTPLGSTTANQLPGTGVSQGQLFVSMNATTGTPEMTALGQGLFHEGEWFVTGEGEISANQYGHVLKPRQTVTIKGVGETYSGVYYVSHVTHTFTQDGYTQTFRVKRNGLFPTGSEDFAGSSGGLF